ncbi:MarR family winged helix-turn-helix transcriptional regulator [Deinococcus soli (ex Cha et al. 2016)]|uniref:DNA-binding MarR family transcriptional regulator n=2 Tax=Deinococcus soli (ex Cha et al. 2016) TaxID=1309411 RepID=A0ACC6KQ98_9DEIO|nr:MarR family winged helix-turn-helix transcriptional regulator [Deinococcus soli (ex Cha et al. 2016)]MDR6221478.1 DNA-binding MarR family transcriptional regulator [Deinococcus soli (ex Cha et al. 2016)]MDR6331473.1 DNA-binding MarR family transcriptional regulator [Deinococcus soli (ex Cha et al. 2016)]MDR6754640.1 DNA-binding MarR family transcriptional regulator [Deinococcus soli (ex Cha et al. 2016)]
MTQDPSDLLRRITRLHTTLQQHTASCCGIHSLTRCQVLTTLGRAGPLTLADLGRHLGADKAWMSRNVDELAREGLVDKQAGQTDRRVVVLTLTPDGQAQVRRLNTELGQQSARLLGRVPQDEQANVLRALEFLADALEAECACVTEGSGACTAP